MKDYQDGIVTPIVGVTYPEYVAWDLNLRGEVIDSIPSKSKRKFLKKAEEILFDNSISFEVTTIDSKQHFELLIEFHNRCHIEKQHDIITNCEWYFINLSRGRVMECLRLVKAGQLVGLKIYSYDSTGFYFSYKSTLREFDRLLNLGLILDFLSFKRAKELGYSKLCIGKEKNLYGLFTQISVYSYKVSLGLEIRSAFGSKINAIDFADQRLNAYLIMLCTINGKQRLINVIPDPIQNSIRDQVHSPINIQIERAGFKELSSLQGTL